MAYPISGSSSINSPRDRDSGFTWGSFSWGGNNQNAYPWAPGNDPIVPNHNIPSGRDARNAEPPNSTSTSVWGTAPGPGATNDDNGSVWDDFGGGSGGGGGGGGGYAAPGINTSMLGSRSHLDAAMGKLNQARDEALEEKAGLDAQFSQRMDALREQFQFTETADEKRMLSRMLAELEAQRDAGYRAIASGYQQAVGNVQDRGEKMRAQTAVEQAAVGDLYDGAVAATQATGGQLNEAYDSMGGGALGVAADGGPAPVGDWAALLASEGAAEQALTGRLGEIGAEGADWMADTLVGQQQAQQGDLNRLAMSTSAKADMEHQRRVLDRIQQERMMFNQLYSQTRNNYDQRGWSLGDQARQVLADQGQMEYQFGEADIGRRLQAAMAQAQLTAGARASASSGGGVAGLSPDQAMVNVFNQPTTAQQRLMAELYVSQGALSEAFLARLDGGSAPGATSGYQNQANNTAANRNALRG